ncbi:MAG: PDDEXK nuclease domain-containing protein [Fibrobacter sp.]|nr:PDDEXK nuclease domain-containing protein [Fibrobacter sp.]
MDKVSPIYNNIVQQIKSAILESQLESARAVNQQMLSLYYAIGQFVSANSREGTWGTGAIETISAQLRREMPGLRGFSATSIKKMRQFYEKWEEFLNRPPMAGELEKAEFDIKTPIIPIHALINLNRSPMAEVLNFSDFLALSFSHHMEILEKTDSVEERAFYIHQAVLNHWDKYLLDFINVEELGERNPQDIDERKSTENPVIGIILCQNADKPFVEYLLQDYNQPMGVATYKAMPEKLKSVLPDEKLLLEAMRK